ncbi:MAG: purine-nucleoside phosphorylase, partial [Lachnospiraceae bacterium]|nr:purine-nucleoside phosphorylase [Lachnospiraceae bacterium]
MSEIYEKLKSCLADVRSRTDFVPEVALVLGSGLGDYADGIRQECVVDYGDIKGFPVSTVPGHAGCFVFG